MVGLSHVCVVGDNEAAFYTVMSGKVSGRVWARVRLLRWINRLCISHNLEVQLALTYSGYNPVDPFSRYHELCPSAPYPCSHTFALRKFASPASRCHASGGTFLCSPSVFPLCNLFPVDLRVLLSSRKTWGFKGNWCFPLTSP